MTEYSFGRVRICWRKASAITSLITMPAGQPAPGSAVDLDGAVLLRRELIAPVPEAAFGELHDVALVHQRHARPLLGDARIRCAARMSRLEPSSDTGLMPMALVAGKRMVWAPICSLEEVDHPPASGVPALYSMPA